MRRTRTSPPSFCRPTERPPETARSRPRRRFGSTPWPTDRCLPALRETLAKAANADQAMAPRASAPKGITVAGQVKNYVPVTDEMLRNPDPADWLMARGNYQAWSYSPLAQITSENVKRLQLAWVWAMNDGGANEPTPIVHDGIIYLTNTSNTLQALDGRTGDLIWENRIGPESTRAYGATRTLAIYDDKLFLTTTDARLYALDARTGKIVWQTAIADGKQGYSNTSGAIVINGKVLTGMTGCGRYGADCYISAYDARTGKQVWRFSTIAREGQPGGDTWGKLPNLLRAGGDTWIAGSYDPGLNLTYWGVAQPKPWLRVSRGAKPGDKALFTSSTLALDPDTGRLKWYFQHAPGESFDMDEVFERVLVDLDGSKLLFTIGKPGILWKLDRETGKFLGHKETVFQNLFTQHRPEDRRTDLPQRHPGAADRPVVSDLSQHRRRPQLAGHELPSGNGAAHHPAEPELHGDVRPQGGIQGEFGRRSGGPPLSRDAERPRQYRQAGGLRCAHPERELVDRAARAVSDRGALHGRRSRLRRRPRPLFPRQSTSRPARCFGKRGSGPRCRAIRSRSPSTANNTLPSPPGLGGGSPRDVPRVIAPEIHHPATATRFTCSPCRTTGSSRGLSL